MIFYELASTSSAAFIAPISTNGTPLPGCVLAPTQCSPFAFGPCLRPGRKKESASNGCERPKTLPRAKPYARFHPGGVRTRSSTMASANPAMPAVSNAAITAARAVGMSRSVAVWTSASLRPSGKGGTGTKTMIASSVGRSHTLGSVRAGACT